MSPQTFHRLFRLSAYYDIAVTWPYATPLTLAMMWTMLGGTQSALGLPPLPDLNAYTTLFANFFGTVVLIWSIVRLRMNDSRLARYDAAGRWLFSAWMLNALLNGASPILWVFLAIELTFAVLQSLPVRAPSVA
ncbi:hypothetical protein [Shimia sp. Alg240-R146]|uniref:hypothetical protein n=1 Tax=Shimia sp. Alg240-R146 TaxID=2993449 RepID=UPI0022E01B64|nr:hypothetical protein [Shimia sp. Alg240-R146]